MSLLMETLLSLAFMIIGLAVLYYLVKKELL
jgi:hypothetical protein